MLLKRIIEGQRDALAGHDFEVQTNYAARKKCNVRTLRNSAREKFLAMAQQTCWDQGWTSRAAWQGHSTHRI